MTKKSQDGITRPLDKIVSTLAHHYGFSVEWCDVLEKWIVKGEESNCYFYWCDLDNREDFFNDLKSYHMEIGYQSMQC